MLSKVVAVVAAVAMVGEQATQAAAQSAFGIFWFNANPARVLNVADGGNINGGRVQLGDNNGAGAAQQWELTANEQIRWVGTNKCLDVAGGVNQNGNLIQMWECQPNNPNQKFALVTASDSAARVIQWKGMGKCFDVKDGSTALGTGIQIWDCCLHCQNHMFQLVDASIVQVAGSTSTTYAAAAATCASLVPSRPLASFADLCTASNTPTPQLNSVVGAGVTLPYIGDVWVPVRDAANEWVQLGSPAHVAMCRLHGPLYGSPEWGQNSAPVSWRGKVFCGPVASPNVLDAVAYYGDFAPCTPALCPGAQNSNPPSYTGYISVSFSGVVEVSLRGLDFPVNQQFQLFDGAYNLLASFTSASGTDFKGVVATLAGTVPNTFIVNNPGIKSIVTTTSVVQKIASHGILKPCTRATCYNDPQNDNNPASYTGSVSIASNGAVNVNLRGLNFAPGQSFALHDKSLGQIGMFVSASGLDFSGVVAVLSPSAFPQVVTIRVVGGKSIAVAYLVPIDAPKKLVSVEDRTIAYFADLTPCTPELCYGYTQNTNNPASASGTITVSHSGLVRAQFRGLNFGPNKQLQVCDPFGCVATVTSASGTDFVTTLASMRSNRLEINDPAAGKSVLTTTNFVQLSARVAEITPFGFAPRSYTGSFAISPEGMITVNLFGLNFPSPKVLEVWDSSSSRGPIATFTVTSGYEFSGVVGRASGGETSLSINDPSENRNAIADGTLSSRSIITYPTWLETCNFGAPGDGCRANDGTWCRNDQNFGGCMSDHTGMGTDDGTWCRHDHNFFGCLGDHGHGIRALDGTWCRHDQNQLGCLQDHARAPRISGGGFKMINDAYSCGTHYTVYENSCSTGRQLCSGNLAARGQPGDVADCNPNISFLSMYYVCVRFENDAVGDCQTRDMQSTVSCNYYDSCPLWAGHYSGTGAWWGN